MDPAGLVRLHRAHDLGGQERLGCGSPGATGAAGRCHDELCLGEQSRCQQRPEGQGDGGRVAAGNRHPPGLADRGSGARQFRKAVGPSPRMFPRVVLLPVGLGDKSVVGTEVDDQRPVVGQCSSDGGGLSVRQGQEHDVVMRQVRRVGGGEHLVAPVCQARVHVGDPHPRLGPGRQQGHIDGRVSGQQSDEFAARVPAGPHDGCRVPVTLMHVCEYTHGFVASCTPFSRPSPPLVCELRRWCGRVGS